MAMNYFEGSSSAKRYARFRPYFHPLVIERIGEITGPVECALDVGCGTGQSALALLAVAGNVFGVDAAGEMLRYAPRNRRITFREAPAEALPFTDDSFDLLTAGLAFHWFDQARFLGEVARVLKPLGWLAIYNDGFTGVMVSNPAYEDWNRERYLSRFPTPPRNALAANKEDWERSGLKHTTNVEFTHDVEAGNEDWCGYLMTQSNVIAVLEGGSDSPDSVRTWLLDELEIVNAKEEGVFRFHCMLDVYQLHSA